MVADATIHKEHFSKLKPHNSLYQRHNVHAKEQIHQTSAVPPRHQSGTVDEVKMMEDIETNRCLFSGFVRPPT